jgi:DNA-binding protein WhiA
MSFSSLQKSEIIEQQYKNQCCRRALINGIMAAKAKTLNGVVDISLGSLEIAEFAAKLISEFFGKEAEPYRSKLGGRNSIVTFKSPAAAKYVSSLSSGAEFFAEKCDTCRASFLKGFFLASGRICDPQKQFLLEFSPYEHERFFDFLISIGINAKFTERKKEKILYVKKSSEIEDFFGFAGMNGTAFALINAKIENELRNNANRLANCDTNNIDKAINASQQQLGIIKELENKGLLSSLPEELERTARFRLKHHDLSLSSLAKISIPPISKSGLSHRLNKIMELAKALLNKN